MAAIIYDAIVNGESATETANGFSVSRKIMISNLTYGTYARSGGPVITMDNLIAAAMDALDYYYNGRYALGAVHPGIGANCYLRERTPRALSKDVVEIALSYDSILNEHAKVSFGGGVESAECNRGYPRTTGTFEQYSSPQYGALENMYVTYNSVKEGVQAQSGIAVVQITVEQDEFLDFNAMMNKIILHTNTLNDAEFLGRQAGMLYCQEIHADRIYAFQYGPKKIDMGYFNVRYVFAYRFTPTYLFWDTELVYTVPSTGRPPNPITAGVERKRYRVYQTSNWADLNIRF